MVIVVTATHGRANRSPGTALKYILSFKGKRTSAISKFAANCAVNFAHRDDDDRVLRDVEQLIAANSAIILLLGAAILKSHDLKAIDRAGVREIDLPNLVIGCPGDIGRREFQIRFEHAFANGQQAESAGDDRDQDNQGAQSECEPSPWLCRLVHTARL